MKCFDRQTVCRSVRRNVTEKVPLPYRKSQSFCYARIFLCAAYVICLSVLYRGGMCALYPFTQKKNAQGIVAAQPHFFKNAAAVHGAVPYARRSTETAQSPSVCRSWQTVRPYYYFSVATSASTSASLMPCFVKYARAPFAGVVPFAMNAYIGSKFAFAMMSYLRLFFST